MASGRSLTHRLVVFATTVAVILGATPRLTPPAAAAPDNTLGMAILSAKVNADGTLAFGSGTTGGQAVGTGSYQVDFDRDVSSCVYNVTLNGSHGHMYAQPWPGVATRALVAITNPDNTVAVNRSFFLLVYCHK